MIKTIRDQDSWQPVLIPFNEVEIFIKENPNISIINEIERNLEELFLLRNPKYRFDKNYENDFKIFLTEYSNKSFGNWFYFPWSKTLICYFPEELHQELRTGRNKYLITAQEQSRFYDATVVFLGMSVGSHIAIVMTMSGGAKHLRLADPDVLSGDNLNRIRTGFQNVGLNKAVVVARQIYEINPYAEVKIYTDGIADENADAIFENADVVVEEMDNMYWKLRARELAREKGIAVLMGTDNGDGAIIDIERYDISRELPILNGYAKGLSAEKLKSMNPKDLPKVAGKIAGANLTVSRMLYSVSEVGKSLYSWPQLGTAANMCGSIIAMLARRIINKDAKIKSGRYSMNLDSKFESGYRSRWLSRKIDFLKFIKKMAK
jgi:molybdopterin/thiamine biosynthesis adenylyltransferase